MEKNLTHPNLGEDLKKKPERKVPPQLKGKPYNFKINHNCTCILFKNAAIHLLNEISKFRTLQKNDVWMIFLQQKKSTAQKPQRRYTMFATKLAALGRDDIIHGSRNANHLRTRPVNPPKKRGMPWKPKKTCLRFLVFFFRPILKIFVVVKELEGGAEEDLYSSYPFSHSSFGTSEMCVLFPDQEKQIPFSKCLSTRPRHTSIFGCQCFSRFHCTIRSWSGKFTGASWFEDLVAGPLMPHVKILFITMLFNHHPPKTTKKKQKNDAAFSNFRSPIPGLLSSNPHLCLHHPHHLRTRSRSHFPAAPHTCHFMRTKW